MTDNYESLTDRQLKAEYRERGLWLPRYTNTREALIRGLRYFDSAGLEEED